MTAIPKTVKLDATIIHRLTRLAKRRDRSLHYLMCEAIQQFLARAEQQEHTIHEAIVTWRGVEEPLTIPSAGAAGDAPPQITIIAVQKP